MSDEVFPCCDHCQHQFYDHDEGHPIACTACLAHLFWSHQETSRRMTKHEAFELLEEFRAEREPVCSFA